MKSGRGAHALAAAFFFDMAVREADFLLDRAFGACVWPWVLTAVTLTFAAVVVRYAKTVYPGLKTMRRSRRFPLFACGAALMLFVSQFLGRGAVWQALGVADAAAFGWAMAKQVWNDLGGRTIVRPRRNDIEVAEGSGGTPPSFAERAWDIALNDIPVLSGVLGGSLRMTLTKEQRLDQVERELLAPIRAVKNRRSEELMKMMLESPVANNGSETPEIKEKLDAWAKKYEWDEAERGNVFACAFNGYQAATAAGQELAAQRKEANRQKRFASRPASERRAMEAAGLAVIQSE